MARGIIGVIKEWNQNKKKEKLKRELGIDVSQEKPSIKNKTENDVLSKINKINKKADEILMIAEPQIYTLAKENNIACKYGENIIITKDGNASIAVELKGVSYAGISLDDETDYLLNRVMFFTTLKDDVEINLIIKYKSVCERDHKKMGNQSRYIRYKILFNNFYDDEKYHRTTGKL